MMFDKNICPSCQREISRAEAFHNNGMCRKCYQKSNYHEDLLHKPKSLLDRWHDEYYGNNYYYEEFDD